MNKEPSVSDRSVSNMLQPVSNGKWQHVHMLVPPYKSELTYPSTTPLAQRNRVLLPNCQDGSWLYAPLCPFDVDCTSKAVILEMDGAYAKYALWIEVLAMHTHKSFPFRADAAACW